jgi:lysophospholipase L1-like esterase
MRLTGWLIIPVLSVASGCNSGASPSPCEPPSDEAGALRILVLGDSIAEGQPLAGTDRWSERLAGILRAALPDRVVEVRNAARNGSRVDYLESSIVAQEDLASFTVAIVIEGVNDLGVTQLAEWAPRYERAVETLEAKGLAVIIGTAPPLLDDGRFSDTYDRIAATLRSIASEHDGRLLDIERLWRERGAEAAAAFYADRIHQSAAGQAVMADLAAGLILELLTVC